jgi:hypothetical protein
MTPIYDAEGRSSIEGATVLRHAAWATIVILGVTTIPLVGHAHDSWINKGGYRNAAGEWCCGEYDCESPEQIASMGLGWVVNGIEDVPYHEATPSPDGKVWICRRPDKTRRCVFDLRRTREHFAGKSEERRSRAGPGGAAVRFGKIVRQRAATISSMPPEERPVLVIELEAHGAPQVSAKLDGTSAHQVIEFSRALDAAKRPI